MILKEVELEIEVLTGLRIGGEKETFEVGGLDNPVIRVVYDKEKRVPIIPGSSVKGRMSMLLEKEYGVGYKIEEKDEEKVSLPSPEENKVIYYGAKEEGKRVHKLFRSTDGVKLIFSDLLPTSDTIAFWSELEKKDATYDTGTEIKMENVINRVSGKALHPRRMERVVRGSRFKGVITLVYENEEEEKKNWELDKKIVLKGCELLAKTYLGGCGSRGYGRVKVKIRNEKEGLNMEFKPDYLE